MSIYVGIVCFDLCPYGLCQPMSVWSVSSYVGIVCVDLRQYSLCQIYVSMVCVNLRQYSLCQTVGTDSVRTSLMQTQGMLLLW